jgi:processing peptidase subunit alpha
VSALYSRLTNIMQVTQSSKLLAQPLVRALATSCSALSSVALVKPSSGGLFNFGSSRLDVPLSEPLPGLPVPLKSSVPAVPAKLETSALADGFRITSIATPSPATTVALVVSGGSSLETSATAGASKVLESLAFKASQNRTTFRITRELEKIGAVGYAKAGRDSITYAIDTVKLHTPEAVEILLDSVLNARLLYHEFRDECELVKEVLANLRANPAAALADAVHRVAYEGPLGQPLLSDPKGLTVESLREFYAAALKPSNLLLAGIGSEHAELKSLADQLVEDAHLEKGATTSSASKYYGGSANIISDSAETHVALAFEAKGGLSDAKTSAMAAVTKALLDEGRHTIPYSVDPDGPKPLSSFSYSYKDTGLVGVTGTSSPSGASALVDSVYKKVASLSSGVTDVQLKMAKQVAIGVNKASLGSVPTALPLIASQLIATGKYDAADFVANVEAITASQISAFIRDLSKSAPTLVTYGALASLPRYDNVAKRLG